MLKRSAKANIEGKIVKKNADEVVHRLVDVVLWTA